MNEKTCGECRFAKPTLYDALVECWIDMETYPKTKEACPRFEVRLQKRGEG